MFFLLLYDKKLAPFILLTFMHILIIAQVQSEIDSWQAIHRGGTSAVIEVNSKALYSVSTTNSLSLMSDDSGFHTMDPAYVKDVAVNDDYGVWIVRKNDDIFYRKGVKPGNLKGDEWRQAPGALDGITTGQYGLVLGHTSGRKVYSRTGISANNHFGIDWELHSVTGFVDESCGKLACFSINAQNTLFTTGKVDNTDSLKVQTGWIQLSDNVSDVSAYGEKTLWKLTTNKEAWEAVAISNDFKMIQWTQRGRSSHLLKGIAATDKMAFAIGSDDGIYVLTGCPIFDFEDNDISHWNQTGTAFAVQPVVSFSFYTVAGKPGKVGHRLIDTVSSRKDYNMPENSDHYAGGTPVGTLTSPYFQIQTKMLHFTIGGGSHPYNYVSLVIDNIEKFNSSGISARYHGAKEDMATGRFWWDVTMYKGRCAKIRIYDQSSTFWGFTMFDDLRASPPCLDGMNVTLHNINHNNTVVVGEIIKFSLKLQGFYTSKMRPLNMTISFPLLNKNPLAYIEKVSLSTRCHSNVSLIRNSTFSESGHRHKLKLSLVNLLSDGELEIEARAYDHEDLKAVHHETIMSITVSFLDEYRKMFRNNVTVQWPHRKLAKLIVQREILGNKEYHVGENITLNMTFTHNNTKSLQTASNILIKIHIPPYISFMSVSEEHHISHRVSILSQKDTKQTFKIKEILLGEKQVLLFTFAIKGDSKWNIKRGKIIQGHILVDFISYCPRPDCLNQFENATEVDLTYTNTAHAFRFSYHEQAKQTEYNAAYTKVTDNDISVICGPYQNRKMFYGSNCYFAQRNGIAWHSLSPLLSNVSCYDPVKKEIFGTSSIGPYIRLHGERFKLHQMLTPQQWNDVILASGQMLQPSIDTKAYRAKQPKLNFHDRHFQWQCCED